MHHLPHELLGDTSPLNHDTKESWNVATQTRGQGCYAGKTNFPYFPNFPQASLRALRQLVHHATPADPCPLSPSLGQCPPHTHTAANTSQQKQRMDTRCVRRCCRDTAASPPAPTVHRLPRCRTLQLLFFPFLNFTPLSSSLSASPPAQELREGRDCVCDNQAQQVLGKYLLIKEMTA